MTAFKAANNYLAHELPWFTILPEAGESITFCTDGSFFQVVELTPPDGELLPPEYRGDHVAAWQSCIKDLGEGWSVWMDEPHEPVAETLFPFAPVANPAARLAMLARRMQFFETGLYFGSRVYMALQWVKRGRRSNFFRNMIFVPDPGEVQGDFQQDAAHFAHQAEGVWQELSFLYPRVIGGDELRAYFHNLISMSRMDQVAGEPGAVVPPQIVDMPIIGGQYPEIGTEDHPDHHHIRMVTLQNFAGRLPAGGLDRAGGVRAMPIHYRRVVRVVMQGEERADKELSRLYSKANFGRQSILAQALRQAKPDLNIGDTNRRSALMAEYADQWLHDLAHGKVGRAHVTATFTVMARTKEQALADARAIQGAMKRARLIGTLETINSMESFLGSRPGNTQADVTRNGVNTLVAGAIAPLSLPARGEDPNPYMGPLHTLMFETGGCGLLPVTLHTGPNNDNGQTLITGMPGAGKSTLQNAMDIGHSLHEGAASFRTDKGRSALVTTYCLGGAFFDVERGDGFQPVRFLDSEEEIRAAYNWLLYIVTRDDAAAARTAQVRDGIRHALDIMAATYSPDERTLSAFTYLCRASAVKDALKPYTTTFKSIFDQVDSRSWDAPMITMEVGALIDGRSDAISPLFLYFWQMQRRLRMRHRRLQSTFDELWAFMDDATMEGEGGDETFSSGLNNAMRTVRRDGGNVVFSTQSPMDWHNCTMGPALVTTAPNRFYCADPSAASKDTSAVLRDLKLNDQMIAAIANPTARHNYLFHRPLDGVARVVSLAIHPDPDEPAAALYWMTAATSKRDWMRAEDLMKRLDHPSQFLPAWLRENGVHWAAEMVEQDMSSEPLLLEAAQ